MLLENLRNQVVEYGSKLSESGLVVGTSGNVSAFDPSSGLMAISPSGMSYDCIKASDVVVMDLEGNVVDGCRKPSSEHALHSHVYKLKPSMQGVVHTHSRYCTTFSILGMPVKPVHFMLAETGASEVPVAPYRTFGSDELAEVTASAMGEARAVLMSNHGLLTCGESLADAFGIAVDVEYVAELQYLSMSIGKPSVLSDEDLKDALERFGSYGQR